MGYQIGHQTPYDEPSSPSDAAKSSFDSLAHQESLDFFTDITDKEWNNLKMKVKEMQPNTLGNPREGPLVMGEWLQSHYEPDFVCRHERRIGKLGDGGKWVCDPQYISQSNSCLVYSIGSNGETSFEEAIFKSIGSHCEVHTFDFDDYKDVVEATGAHYHQWGLSDTMGTHKQYSKKVGGQINAEFKTLADTVKLLGHEDRMIDIFKIDCEGCEWTTFSSWFENTNVKMRQVLIELHSEQGPKKLAPLASAADFFTAMYRQGYVIFHKEPNIHYWGMGRRNAIEYGFLLLNQSFFQDPETGKSWLKDSSSTEQR